MQPDRLLTVLDKQEAIRAHRESGVDLNTLSRKYDKTMKGMEYILAQEDAIMAVHPLVAGTLYVLLMGSKESWLLLSDQDTVSLGTNCT